MHKDEEMTRMNRWTILGWGFLLCLGIICILPAIPGRPGVPEEHLAKMVNSWGGQVIIHSGLVRAVELNSTCIQDEDITELHQALTNLTSPEALRYLNLSNTAISDAGINILNKTRSHWLQLDLKHTMITDRGLALISNGFYGLNTLHIEGNSITEEGLSQLYKHSSLEDVYVSGPHVTKDIIKRLTRDRKDGHLCFHLVEPEECQTKK